MELELGLSLPNQNSIEGFDMNKTYWTFKPKEKPMMGLDNNSWILGSCLEAKGEVPSKKRSHEDAFGETTKNGSSLLVWNGQPNGEDDRHGKREKPSCTINIQGDNEEGNRVVGWPPIKSWRKKLIQQHPGYRSIENNNNNNNNRRAEKENQVGNTLYVVKVKMEGVTIVRKVDLRLYNSYQMLKSALITMFDEEDDNRHANYTLTYLDKKGNWLSAGDVPWQIFMETVQRLEVSRN